ncbi:sensor histidine kinase [Ochrovirga pacifica]|uniref:sensor histidine kinase n=1 Tax=Ochrovirga pacifica TaxID=1042376 RepID=UPI0002559877|nr:HAMP domain-containing sensor histidine kinase [Ochrovirga pacifica]
MKLLRKTLKLYLVFSIIIFLISVPVFYFLVQDLWISDVDDTLIYQKENIINGIEEKDMDSISIVQFSEALSKTDAGISITQISGNHLAKDSIYYNNFYEISRQHVEPYRELKSIVEANNNWYKIIIRKDLVESEDLIQGIVFVQIVLFLIFLTGMLLLNSYFSKKTWKPFYFIISKLQSYKIDSEQPIETVSSDIEEFNTLNHSVQKLTENNIQIFRAQKEFTENAAHETQTPLAVIKNQVDLLVQDKQISKNQSEIINKISKHVNLLTKLNRNLLMLSKIENNQFAKKDSVIVSDIIDEIHDMFKEHIDLKKIHVVSEISNIKPIVSNKQLIQSLIINLMGNAIKYNIEGGTIKIVLKDSSLSFTNTGINVSLQKDRVFERFYKQSQQIESVGLGLAIVKQICDTLGYKISYQFIFPNKHTFTVLF